MGETEPEEDVLLQIGEDMGHIGIVADDFHRPRKAGHRQGCVVVGQRSGGEHIGDQHRAESEPRKQREEPECPKEKLGHVRGVP